MGKRNRVKQGRLLTLRRDAPVTALQGQINNQPIHAPWGISTLPNTTMLAFKEH